MAVRLIQRVLHSNQGRSLIAAAIAVAIVAAIALASLPKSQPEIECYVGQTQSMTVQEVANLLKIPLVDLTWLPNNLTVSSVITTTPYYSNSPYCQVEIDYPNSNSAKTDAIIYLYIYQSGSIEPTKMPTSCSYHFDPNGPINTDCSIEVDGANSTLRVNFRLGPVIAPEDALKILDGMRVVEPQE
jgi:hypothetical protein